MTTENTTVERSAAEQVADALLARTSDASVMAMLQSDMKAVDDVSSTGGYDNALEISKAIGLSQSELALWMEPSAKTKPDVIGTAVNQRHDQIAPSHGPSRRNTFSRALQLAVDAMPLDEAKEAKDGTAEKKDKYPLVPKAHGPSKDNQKNAPATGDKAYAELHKLWSDAASKGETELAAIYVQACQCAVSDNDISQSDIDRLGSARNVRIARVRQMAADKQARVVNGGRFRSILFLALIEEELTNFMRVSGKSVGSVWSEAAAKAKAAHADYMDKLPKGTAVDVSAMVSSMRGNARDYLLGKSGTKQAVSKGDAEKIREANAAMFANARKLVNLAAVEDSFSDKLLSAIADGLFNDGQFLTAIGVVMDCAGLKTEERERLRKEEEERQAKAERDEQERIETAQRKAERDAKKAEAAAKAQADIDAKAKLAKDQAEIDAAKEATAKANQPTDDENELSAEEKLAAKRSKKAAA